MLVKSSDLEWCLTVNSFLSSLTLDNGGVVFYISFIAVYSEFTCLPRFLVNSDHEVCAKIRTALSNLSL